MPFLTNVRNNSNSSRGNIITLISIPTIFIIKCIDVIRILNSSAYRWCESVFKTESGFKSAFGQQETPQSYIIIVFA